MGAGDLDVRPGGPVPAGMEFGMPLLGAVPKQSAVHDQLYSRVQVLHSRVVKYLGGQRRAGANHP